MFKINFLKANDGDAIHISYKVNDVTKNILIDTGTSATYSSKPNRRPKYGELKELIDTLLSNNQKINLLVITHWDDDHIGGVLKWFEEDLESAKSLIEHIWFNSGILINQYFDSKEASEDNDILNLEFNPNTSIRQGIAFEKYILDNGFSNKELIKSNMIIDDLLEGAKFTIISPTDTQLKWLLKKWEKSPYNPNTSSENDYGESFEDLLVNEFQEDNRKHNGNSIAFILEIEDKKMLFLGDAHPSVIVDELKKLNYSKDIDKRLTIDFVKVSHHGSSANTSDELLDLIESKKFIISSDGSSHGNPNKETIARIVNKHEGCKIYFNYPHLIDKMFTAEELKSEKFEALDASEFDI